MKPLVEDEREPLVEFCIERSPEGANEHPRSPSPLAGLFPGPVVTRGSLRFTPGYCLIIPSGFRSLVVQALIAKTHTGGDIV